MGNATDGLLAGEEPAEGIACVTLGYTPSADALARPVQHGHQPPLTYPGLSICAEQALQRARSPAR